MFEKNLNDLVRGLRNNKNTEAKYVTECLDEIKQELRQENMVIKANAVLKLSYIQMIGYDVSWAAFNMIEVMSSQKFTHKRIAYMAASQSFHSDLDVLMLATNLIKKDMNSQNQYDAGVAMVGLSCFVSPDLARDLANDIMSMMVSSRPYIRKRAILLMYKVFLNFPESLRPAFPRLKERLEDEDQGVQCAAVNVICELARKNPQNYLSLAPLFFKLMTTSSNNWMLIKIIKLFGALCPLEPRLGKKLLEPLTSLIHSTSAMSLLYECINTVVAGVPEHQPSLQLCVTKLRLLIEDPDQNLKYLGLLLLNKILKTQPKLVLGHKDVILQCLDGNDESIRYRALDLISGMVTKKTLVDIVKKLMAHMEKSEGSSYRDELLSKILKMCSQCNYQFITSFEWYIDILLQLSTVDGTKYGKMIANQMLDVTIRVKVVRKYAVPLFASLLGRTSSMTGSSCEKNSSCEVFFAAAWVLGEFAEYLSDLDSVMDWLVHPRVTSLPGHVQCVYIQAVGKIFSIKLAKYENEGEGEIDELSEKLIKALPVFTQSSDLEVQDRSCCILQLIKLVSKMRKEGVKCSADVSALFAEELLPVAPQAQKKVPVPEGLDLDKWINEPLSDDDDSDVVEDSKPFFSDDKGSNKASYQQSQNQSNVNKYVDPDPEELEKAREIRKMFEEGNPHYLKMGSPSSKSQDQNGVAVDDIPVKELDFSVSLQLSNGLDTEKGKKKSKKGKKGKRGKHEAEEEEQPETVFEIAPVLDLDEDTGPVAHAGESVGDIHDLLNVDLNSPLEDHEVLPVAQHRITQNKPMSKPTSKKGKGQTEKERKKKSKTKEVDPDSEKKTKKEKSSKRKKEKQSEDKTIEQTTLLAVASKYAQEVNGKPLEISEGPPAEPVKAEKKKKKKKGEKKEKTKKSSVEKTVEISENVDMMMEMDDLQPDPWQNYNLLGEDENLKLLNEIRINPRVESQVICSIIFKNLTTNHIQKLEFNVVDSLNMKLIRQTDDLSQESILVPFQLLPQMSNEGQFAFTVENCDMSQHLRGTLTYIVKDGDDKSTSEKIDFRINFPVSAYLQAIPISSQDFTQLLASGNLKEKQNVKINLEKNIALGELVQAICLKMKLVVVEHVDGCASFYGFTFRKQSVCLLVKFVELTMSIDGKSDNFQLLTSVLKEVEELVKNV